MVEGCTHNTIVGHFQKNPIHMKISGSGTQTINHQSENNVDSANTRRNSWYTLCLTLTTFMKCFDTADWLISALETAGWFVSVPVLAAWNDFLDCPKNSYCLGLLTDPTLEIGYRQAAHLTLFRTHNSNFCWDHVDHGIIYHYGHLSYATNPIQIKERGNDFVSHDICNQADQDRKDSLLYLSRGDFLSR